MSVSPKWNAILLQFLHRFEAHTLPFSVRFQFGLQNFAHIASIWKKQTQYFSYISQEERWQSILNLLFMFIKCFWFGLTDLISGLYKPILFVLNGQSTNHDSGCQATFEQDVQNKEVLHFHNCPTEK